MDLMTRGELINEVRGRLADPTAKRLFIASANLDHIHHFGEGSSDGFPGRGDAGGDWRVLLDGMPLVWMANHVTGQSWERLAGADLLIDLLQVAAGCGVSVGFLGGTEKTHGSLRSILPIQIPSLRVGGYWAPERSVLEDPSGVAALADDVRRAGVGMLVVSLGIPRQERWLSEYGEASGIKVGLAFGAAADFLAGTRRRAPMAIRRLGLEWLHRLVLEPRRLASRYLIQGPRALARLLRHSASLGQEEPIQRPG